jgi:hypothetical protein
MKYTEKLLAENVNLIDHFVDAGIDERIIIYYNEFEINNVEESIIEWINLM